MSATGSHRPPTSRSSTPSRRSASSAPPAAAAKYIPLVLKTKKPDGKWQVHAYLNLKADLSGGVATLVMPDGTKLEKVAIFPNDKKASDGKAEQS